MSEIIGQKAGRFVISFDRARGIAVAELIGFWAAEDASDYLKPIELATNASRQQHGHALVLFDLIQSQIMSSAFFESYQAKGSPFIRPGDRVALVVQSSLLKGQTKRLGSQRGDKNAYFASRTEAEAWLYSQLHAA